MENLDLTAASRGLVERMEHVHLVSGDLDRSADFYRRAFGFGVRFDGTGMYGRCVHVGTDRFYVALSEGTPGGGGFAHVGLVSRDLDGLRRRLERESIRVVEQSDRKENRAIYVEDPDGYEIEIAEYKAGYVYA